MRDYGESMKVKSDIRNPKSKIRNQKGYPIPNTMVKSSRLYGPLRKIQCDVPLSNGSRSFIPISTLATTNLKSNLKPVPVPTAISL